MRRAPCALLLAVTVLAACEKDPIRPTLDRTSLREEVPAPPPPALAEANAIVATIRGRHMPGPMNIIIDPQFADSLAGANDLQYFRHLGDAAIWTGHYLAAEAFRYGATADADALGGVNTALSGIERLVKVTSTTSTGTAQTPRLARFYMPASPTDEWSQQYIDGAYAHEASTAFFVSKQGTTLYKWMGNVSRDQYSGVFFGLSVAYDLVPDAAIRGRISTVATQLLDYLIGTGWNIRNPDGRISTTFFGRSDQQLSFLQVGRQVNPGKFSATYINMRSRSASSVRTPIALECSDTHGGYYKFNLNHINLYNLIRLEESGTAKTSYMSAFTTLRNCTGTHQNAHFTAIDRAIRGANGVREVAIPDYLAQWRERRRRDYPVNLNGTGIATCGTNRACAPVPIAQRPNTDFLWQRSPFSMVGTGAGTIETAALDYLLPYWMSEYCSRGTGNPKVCI